MGAWVDMAPSAPRLPSYAFYQPVLSEETASKVNKFEGMPMPTYTLERWSKIFQIMDAEAQETPVLLPERIKIEKGEGVNTEKKVFPLIKSPPKKFSLSD